jgi:OOP family OmpA-OmpF porin
MKVPAPEQTVPPEEPESDADNDGVIDTADRCPDTPQGVSVDSKGCPLDSDDDGVPDYKDKCPKTPSAVSVDSNGCPSDSDRDGVSDNRDRCPDTPKGAPVNDQGCWVLENLRFDKNKSAIKSDMQPVLDEALEVLRKNDDVHIEIQGHTDSSGPAEYNMKLSRQRAQSVMDYFVGKGISSARLTAKGFGETEPLAPNDTAKGRAVNRRVQLKPVK